MKRLTFLILLILAAGAASDRDHTLTAGQGVGYFYTSLSPYGEWIDCNLGYVWRPRSAGHDWRPYLNGRWMWTDYGWYWVSYEPFGWATFHYGRWFYDDYNGWIWIPDQVWGPAWVEWRYDDDYIGWAPLTPHVSFHLHIGITVGHDWYSPVHYWNFVTYRHFSATRVNDYVQPVERTRRFFGRTRGSVNIDAEGDRVVNRGVDRDIIERRGQVRLDRAEIITRERAGRDRVGRDGDRTQIEIYRPRLDTPTRGEILRPPDIRRSEREIDLNARPRGDRDPGMRERRLDPSTGGREVPRITPDRTKRERPDVNNTPMDRNRRYERRSDPNREPQRSFTPPIDQRREQQRRPETRERRDERRSVEPRSNDRRERSVTPDRSEPKRDRPPQERRSSEGRRRP